MMHHHYIMQMLEYRKCETLFLKEILNNQVLDVVVAGK